MEMLRVEVIIGTDVKIFFPFIYGRVVESVVCELVLLLMVPSRGGG